MTLSAMTDNPTAKLFTLFAMVLILVSPACASSTDFRYAGLTRAQAIEKGETQLIALSVAFNGISPERAAKTRRWFQAHPPRTTKSACKGTRAWKLIWPRSDPIFVNHRGIVMACYMVKAH